MLESCFQFCLITRGLQILDCFAGFVQSNEVTRNILGAMLVGDEDASCRQAAAWALGRIGGAHATLVSAQQSESNQRVRDAIRVALAM